MATNEEMAQKLSIERAMQKRREETASKLVQVKRAKEQLSAPQKPAAPRKPIAPKPDYTRMPVKKVY